MWPLCGVLGADAVARAGADQRRHALGAGVPARRREHRVVRHPQVGDGALLAL